jgi:hypothetical protein
MRKIVRLIGRHATTEHFPVIYQRVKELNISFNVLILISHKSPSSSTLYAYTIQNNVNAIL